MTVHERFRSIVSRRPTWVAGFWFVLAAVVGLTAPSLSKLSAEGQARVLGPDAESRRAAKLVEHAWPEQSYGSLAVAAIFRPEGLTPEDFKYYHQLSRRFASEEHPRGVLRVLGPESVPEVAARMISKDGTVALLAIPLARPFVSPITQSSVNWLQRQSTRPDFTPPYGLQVSWTGDAVIGRDYMKGIQTSLDRAAIATVILLLIVLLSVYRSLLLSLVPLVTIGISLLISRGLLAWLDVLGWETSPLVELFLVAVLFGSGTDFCLFLSWRFAENWNPVDPAEAMRKTLRTSSLALLTTAGTVIVGLSLMGTTKFKLFSTTGPSVALGLALTLAATLSLTPALLVLLARVRPQAFEGLTRPSSRVWERFGRLAMARPALSWAIAMMLMTPFALVALKANMVQDILSELPRNTRSAEAFEVLSTKFDPGVFSPLTVVLQSEQDLHSSEGLALIDDLSRFLGRQRNLTEVRSATQPLGSPALFARARIDSRLGAVKNGFGAIAEGATKLQKGLNEGAIKLRAAVWIEEKTGLSITGTPVSVTTDPEARPASFPVAAPHTLPNLPSSRDAIVAGFRRASSALLHTGIAGALVASELPSQAPNRQDAPPHSADDPRTRLIDELFHAADGAGEIVAGAGRASREVGAILTDPVGRRALDRLLIDERTVKENPELNRSFATYITPDGHSARIDLTQADRVFSAGAMDQVVTLRRRLNEFLADNDTFKVTARIAGSNADSADIRMLTRADQLQSWFVIPIGVFLVLLVALRDPIACVNLVATMLLTYLFALGATYLVFVVGLGAEGLDWKVPYFLFVLLVAVGVDYNVFLMTRLHEEASSWGLRTGIVRAIGQTGGLITSAAAITACSFASFLSSPLGSLRQLGFALVVGISVDALLVRPLLVPCGHWLLTHRRGGVCPIKHVETSLTPV